MSAYLKVLPAVLLEPEVLFSLGQKLCLIVRDSLLLDARMEDICSAIEREGRTLNEVISRSTIYSSDIDRAAIACEKAVSLLKTGVQIHLFQEDEHRHATAMVLNSTIENPGKHLSKSGYTISGDRIRDIIINLESERMQQALSELHLVAFFEDLKKCYRQYEIIQLENEVNHKEEILPTLRSTVSLYGMLIDTLIANVRFENYRLLHRVDPVISRIETVVNEAVEMTFNQHDKIASDNLEALQNS